MLDREILEPGSLPIIIIENHFLFGSTLELALRAHGWDAWRISATDRDEVRKEAGRFPQLLRCSIWRWG
jgi:hypothetical protein